MAALLGWALACAMSPAAAQAEAVRATTAFWVAGPTWSERQNVDTRDLRGNVVMVYYWTTGCTLCLQKLGELRANAGGWRGKPFQLLLVNLDKTSGDLDAYARTARLMDRRGPAMPVLWAGDPAFGHSLGAAPARLPLTLVLDTQGEVVQRHEGSFSADTWNAVAGLLR